MRRRQVGLIFAILFGLIWLTWLMAATESNIEMVATTAAKPANAPLASPTAPISDTVATPAAAGQSSLATRMRNTYLRQLCRDLPQDMLTEQQMQLACAQNYTALFDELLPRAEAGELSSLGYLLAVTVGCHIQQSVSRRDINQEITRQHQFIQRNAGIIPVDIAAALPEHTALVHGEMTRTACASIEQRGAYVIALAEARKYELESMTARASPWDAYLRLAEAVRGSGQLTAEALAQLRAQLADHQRHNLALNFMRCKLDRCALPISDAEARQWLGDAVEHGDYEALSYWRGQLAQDPARAEEAYAWNLFSRDLLRAGCYPLWFATEANYNFGEMEQLGQRLSGPGLAEAQQLAHSLIAQFGQQARKNLACN